MNIILMNKDIRIENNPALEALLKYSKDIYFFINFNDYVIKKTCINSLNYMKNAILKLSKKIHINIFNAPNEIYILKDIIKRKKIERIYINDCFTPYSIKRKEILKNFCKINKIEFKVLFDFLLIKPGTILSNNKTVLKTFKPFYDKVMKKNFLFKTKKYDFNDMKFIDSKYVINSFEYDLIYDIPLTREEIFAAIKKQKKYALTRDFLDNENYASKIASGINWGIVNFKEVFLESQKLLGNTSQPFVRQLLWREFYYHYYLSCENYLIDKNNRENILKVYDSYPWITNPKNKNFLAWKNARTGIKLIDSAINQLIKKGTMNNRLRMIVSSFLTKDLNIHWILGERYFAKYLIDYDPIINNQSWQWSAGSGLDFRGNNRIFAIEIQQKKFDPKNKYIQKYFPEKNNVPIVEPKTTRKKWRERYKKWKNEIILNNYD